MRHLAERARPSPEPRRDTTAHVATIAKRLYPWHEKSPTARPNGTMESGMPPAGKLGPAGAPCGRSIGRASQTDVRGCAVRMDWLGARTYLLAACAGAGLGRVNVGMPSDQERLGRAEAFGAAGARVRARVLAG